MTHIIMLVLVVEVGDFVSRPYLGCITYNVQLYYLLWYGSVVAVALKPLSMMYNICRTLDLPTLTCFELRQLALIQDNAARNC